MNKEQIENSQELAQEEKKLEDIRSGNKDISQLNEKINLLTKENESLKVTVQNKDEAIFDYGEQLNKVISEKQQIEIELSKMYQDIEKNNKILEKNNITLKHQIEYRAFKKEKSFEAFSYIIDSIETEENLSNYSDVLIKDYLDLGIIERNILGNY